MSKTSLVDMAEFKSGRLTVIARSDTARRDRVYWLCRCECGKETTVAGRDLRQYAVKSCGCWRRQATLWSATRTHGHASHGHLTSTYHAWMNMRTRCTNPNRPDYKNYGGRGIRICQRWESFENFLADMGRRPKGKSLDRYPDNNGNYEPGNCRWATSAQQANNTRRTRRITYAGETLTLTEWAGRFGVSLNALSMRLKKGLPLDGRKPVQAVRPLTPKHVSGRES